MFDSYGDGWHVLTLGIKQDNRWVSTFGGDYSSGSSYGPVTLNVIPNVPAFLAVVAIASYTS